MALGKGRKTVLISFIGCVSVFLAFSPMLKVLLVEEWRLYKLSSPDPSERRSAAEALGDSGTLRAMPRLLELLRGKLEVRERDGIDINRGTFSWAGRLPDREEIGRIPLCFCSPHGQSGGFKDGIISNAVLRIAEKRGRTAVAVLLRKLEAEPPDSQLSVLIVSLLGLIGPEAAEAIPALHRLRAASKKPNPLLWHLAVDAIWEIETRDSPPFSSAGK
jgi:hypothetical protein